MEAHTFLVGLDLDLDLDLDLEEVQEVRRSLHLSCVCLCLCFASPSVEMASQPGPSVPAVEDRDDDGSEGEGEGLYEDLGVAEELEEVKEEVPEKKGRVRRKAADIVKLYGCPKCDKTYSALKVTLYNACGGDPFTCWINLK